MSYYNNVLIIFTKNLYSEPPMFEWRFAGQMLPAGAIPLAVANRNKGKITEIKNNFSPLGIVNFINQTFKENFEISRKYSGIEEYKEINWEYSPS